MCHKNDTADRQRPSKSGVDDIEATRLLLVMRRGISHRMCEALADTGKEVFASAEYETASTSMQDLTPPCSISERVHII